jgi:hypothetical protein
MTIPPQNEPAQRMRKLLASLPKNSKPPASDGKNKADLPALAALPASQGTASKTQEKPASASTSIAVGKMKLNFGPPFWTIASALSLTINLVLIIVLLALVIGLKRYGLNVSAMMSMGTSLLGGLHDNFEKMDEASIATNVQVNTTIPVQFDLQLNQNTNVVLSQPVTIDNAVVTVKTGGLNITNAVTTIVLPQGTVLPITLNLTVPVNTTVPVTLDVPVNIPLNQTELHDPFVGLQLVIKPFYCMLNSKAVNLKGELICQ